MAVSLSFMVGLFQIAFGILNLGCLSILLAKPVVSGFTTASAIVVALAQGTHLFGVPVTRYSGFAGPLKTFGSIIYGILQGTTYFNKF
jgi:SulP family sulfate permease